MSAFALLLVLTGAVCHAVWNAVAKKASGGAPFVFLYGMVSVAAALPFAAWMWVVHRPEFGAAMWSAVIASAVVHVLYSLVLQTAYRASDFAIVYPVARGSGPMLAVVAAVLLLGEKPSLLGWFAVAAILTGVLISAGITRTLQSDARRRQIGALWGMATGAFIATYTIIDGWAIKGLRMDPLVFYVSGLVLRLVLQAPFALRSRPAVAALRQEWRVDRRAIVAVGILSPVAYTLVLFAVQRAPVSYVAPVREISMLIGTLIGARVLHETVKPEQFAGAAIMLCGVAGLAWA